MRAIYAKVPIAAMLAVLSTIAGADDTTALLAAEFARLEPSSGGTMGIAAVHIESGRAAYLNAHDAFPLASTYKVAIAVRLLQPWGRSLR